MRVRVRLEGSLASRFWREKEFEVPDGTMFYRLTRDIFELLGLGGLGSTEDAARALREYAILVLNGKESSLDQELSDGDEISILSPLSGG